MQPQHFVFFVQTHLDSQFFVAKVMVDRFTKGQHSQFATLGLSFGHFTTVILVFKYKTVLTSLL